jgi:hypothetical protein
MKEDAIANINLAVTALAENRLFDAKQLLDKALELIPDEPMALFLFSALAYIAGNIDVSERMMEVAGEKHRLDDEMVNKAIGVIFVNRPEAQREAFFELFTRRWLMTPGYSGERKALLGDGMSPDPWHFIKDEVNWLPREVNRSEEYIGKNFIGDLAPRPPPFDQNSNILAMGSCFARHMRNYLIRRRMSSDWLFVPENLNNTFAIRHFLEWCAYGNASSTAYWYDDAPEQQGAKKWLPLGAPEEHRIVFERCDGVILTIGVAEVWRDALTGGVFWRGVPQSIFDAKRHRVEMSTVAENVENIRVSVAALRHMRPDIDIIVTVSPVPLKATFQKTPCMVADCVSKSTLRLAAHEAVTLANDEKLRYWPSFEIIRWLGSHLAESPFMSADDANDIRHIRPEFVSTIIGSFMRHYFKN